MVAMDAVRSAANYIIELFKDERIDRVRLEELEFSVEEDIWEVTISFQRRWQAESSYSLPRVLHAPPPETDRTYKTVRIRDDGTVVSLRHRDVSVPS